MEKNRKKSTFQKTNVKMNSEKEVKKNQKDFYLSDNFSTEKWRGI